jgi:hypothetical protein
MQVRAAAGSIPAISKPGMSIGLDADREAATFVSLPGPDGERSTASDPPTSAETKKACRNGEPAIHCESHPAKTA